MERAEIDPRYPAEYQPGGESLPQALNRLPEGGGWDAGAPVPVPTEAIQAMEPVAAEPATEPVAEADSGNGGQDSIGMRAVGSGPVPWTVRTWVLGLGAGMVTVLLGVLCLLPKEASRNDPGAANYMLVSLFFPLTDKVLALGPFTVIAGLAMLVAMFLRGAPRHPRASPWLRGGAALVAVAALVAAGLSLFAATLHPEILFVAYGAQADGPASYPWVQLTYLATMPMALFGLFAGAAVAIVRPDRGGRNSLSARRSVAAGIVLVVATAVTMYAPQIFTGSMVPSTYRSGDSSMNMTPWPATLIQVGPYLLLVGLAALLLAFYLRLTTAPVETVPDPAADQDDMG